MKLLEKITKETNNKKKIENTVFLMVILIATLIIINHIWNEKDTEIPEKENNDYNKVLANNEEETENAKEEFAKNIEDILSTIKGVGKVKVLLNYSESSSIVPLYDETTTTSTTEEGDSSGGTRNITEVQSQKEVVFSENSGSKEPYTQKKLMPIIQGAIITASGAGNAVIKTNIITAIQALTGLSADKIQVFEKEN